MFRRREHDPLIYHITSEENTDDGLLARQNSHLALSHAQLTRQLQDIGSEAFALLPYLGRNSSSLGAVLLDESSVLVEYFLRLCTERIHRLISPNRVTISLTWRRMLNRDKRVSDVDPWAVDRQS